MPKFLSTLSAAALLSLAALPAFAGDVYWQTPGSVKDSGVYGILQPWAGFYLGVNGGYGWTGDGGRVVTRNSTDFLSTPGPEASGGFGGGQIGYNWQRERLVFGVEADIQGADIGDTVSGVGIASDGTSVFFRNRQDLDFFGTVRGRLGYVFGNTLFYATGGFAYGDVTNQIIQPLNGAPYLNLKKSDIATGYAIGAGFETPVSRSWTLKAEYQYIDLSGTVLSGQNICGCTTGATTFTSNDLDGAFNTIRVGLNYRFHDVYFNHGYEPLK